MNFQELVQRMTALDQPVHEEELADKDYDGDGEIESGKDEYMGSRMKAADKEVDECGMPGMGNMPNGMMGNRQPDSVTMNISMNGSGAGGLRDLMAVLRDIEDGSDGGHDHKPEMPGSDDGMDPSVIVRKMSAEPIIGQEDYSNQPDEMYSGVDAVTGTGTDMHSNNGDHRQRQAGLPIAKPQMESLVQKLSQHYQDVKSR
jgi:hypothetical protein